MRHVLDTNSSIYHLTGKLAEPLPSDDVFVSVITEIELLSHPLITPDEESRILEFLSSLETVELLPAVRDAAIRLRREHRLKLPDAIIAATALVLDAELLTNDARLLRIPGLRARALALSDAS